MPPLFVLVHSPLVGTFTWSALAPELRARGHDTLTPTLTDDDSNATPYWQQHADSVALKLAAISTEQALILVGHSGAGMLLPAISQQLRQPISAYVFMDAGIPLDGASRLDMLARELPPAAQQVRQTLAEGGRTPNWTDESLRPTLPDASARQQMLAELKPRGERFYTEVIPVYADFPYSPAVYLQLSAGYNYSAQEARKRGWRVSTLSAGHFHMLVDPAAVADALLDLLEDITDGDT